MTNSSKQKKIMSNLSIKVIVVGSSGVGKTSLIASFLNGAFSSNCKPTVAPAQSNILVNVGVTPVELQIWDTAGQERFQSISQMFYRDSRVAFVCFDKDRIDTILDWIDRIRSEEADCTIILVATKEDMLDTNDIVEIEESTKQIIAENNCKCLLFTSAKTGNGVSELFQTAALCYDNAQSVINSVDITTDSSNENKCHC